MSTTTTHNNHRSTTTTTTSAFRIEVAVVTDIAAPAEAVWAVLADTDTYPEWNPFITSLEGTVAVGEKITVVLALPDRKPQTMKPKIVELTPGRTLTWLGGFGVRGVFDGRHRFEVQPIDAHRCRLVHHELLSGALVPMFRTMLTVNTPAAFLAMNEALAQRVTDHG